MRVSVIISAHKSSIYLDECIRSVKAQRFEDYEIILSSDGIDLSWYANKYKIKYLQSEKKNHSHAFNCAADIAQGIYLKDHHYDDIMLPNCLSDLWQGFGASVIYADAINFWQDGKQRVYTMGDNITWDDFWPPVKSGIHAAAYLMKRSDFIAIGGRDEDMNDSEEVEYFMRLLSLGYSFRHINKVVARYRKHDEQKTAVYTREKRDQVEMYLKQKYYDSWHGSTSDI